MTLLYWILQQRWFEAHDELQAAAMDKTAPRETMRLSEVAALTKLPAVELKAALLLFHDLGTLLFYDHEKLADWVNRHSSIASSPYVMYCPLMACTALS